MNNLYDLVIFGGGTVGGAIFLDATSRGLKTALVEKSKIGHQTNQASLGLIQRDPKYLYTDIDLIYMNAVDCGLLKTIAGDLLKKQLIIIPSFSAIRRPLWLLNSYLGVLDQFAGFSGSGTHRKLSKQELISREPFLRKEARGGILYDEWLVDPVELNATMIQSAQNLGGDVFEFFKPFQYTSESAGKHKKIKTVLIRNEKIGKTVLLESSCFINATGPWSPYFLELFKIDPFSTRMTKGTSINVNKKLSNDVVVVFDRHGKYILILPQENSKTLIGPTNEDISEQITQNPDLLLPSEEEIKKLLDMVSRRFTVPLSIDDVLETKCGLRPQLYHRGVKPDKITHEFIIIDHEKRDGMVNLFSVFGGKLSNQIRMAKETVDRITDLEWKIPKLQIKKGGNVEFEKSENGVEKLYAKKFALSHKDNVGKIAFRKKIKSLFFVAYSMLKGWGNAK